mmetsp:Transcript_81235/g.227740  ORF Transcript_81235/g.227740 Transcript_81235/m.227740 type:complete len:81 (+) Transcript_81235:55-297(+)
MHRKLPTLLIHTHYPHSDIVASYKCLVHALYHGGYTHGQAAEFRLNIHPFPSVRCCLDNPTALLSFQLPNLSKRTAKTFL